MQDKSGKWRKKFTQITTKKVNQNKNIHQSKKLNHNNKTIKNFTAEEIILLKLLQSALTKKRFEKSFDCDWETVLELAGAHAVTAVLYDTLKSQQGMPAHLMERACRRSQITVLSNYRLLFLDKYLTEYLEENGIQAITLKGCATASLYPVPECRKSGDIDLLIPNKEDYKKACALLKKAGFYCPNSQSALHHTEFVFKNDKEEIENGIVIELHGMLAAPFENEQMNTYLNTLLSSFEKNISQNTSWGVRFYQPSDAYHGFYLALHMLQHFLREGFGLKNLCDWTVFWNRDIAAAQKRRFLKLVRQSGMEQFVRILTAACVRYLGLSRVRVSFLLKEPVPKEDAALFLREVLDAGEFGGAQKERMVVIQGTGLFAFIKEFHYQMHVNYPRAGRIFVCWPLLWGLTLARFLKNNRRLKRGSVIQIMEKARRRSGLVKRLGVADAGGFHLGKSKADL